MDTFLNRRTALWVVVAVTAWRLYLSATLQLHADEPYYWLWARNLASAYFDHAPMVAYFIRLTTVFSDAEGWLRASGLVAGLVASAVLWHLAMQLFGNERVAAGSVILFNLLPLTMLGLLIMTPDVPLFLFASLSVLLFWQAASGQQPWRWYGLGLVFGLALLSKYTAILMAPCFLLYLLLSDERRWLKTVHPYAGFALSLACFAPVLWWNHAHDWVSFTFQARNGLGSQELALDKVAEFLSGQAFFSSPFIWCAGLCAAFSGVVRKDKRLLFLVTTSVPVIVFFALSSLRKTAYPNWASFAYLSFCLWATYYLLAEGGRMRRVVWAVSLGISASLSLAITSHARFGVLPLEQFSQQAAEADASNQVYGWRELVQELETRYPERKTVVTLSHQLSSLIMYYSDQRLVAKTAKLTRPSQFNYWDWAQDLPVQDALYVWSQADSLVEPGSPYLTAAYSQIFPVQREGRLLRTYYIYAGGKDRPIPFPGE